MRVDIKIQQVPIDKGPSCSMVSGFTIKDATSTHHHICCVFHSGSLWNVFDLPPYNKVCHRLSEYRWFSPCITVSSANNTDILFIQLVTFCVNTPSTLNLQKINVSVPKRQSSIENQYKLATQDAKDEDKQNHNTICVRHHYAHTTKNNVNKTWTLLQTTGGFN